MEGRNPKSDRILTRKSRAESSIRRPRHLARENSGHGAPHLCLGIIRMRVQWYDGGVGITIAVLSGGPPGDSYERNEEKSNEILSKKL